MLPESEFFSKLKDKKSDEASYISIDGTDPNLFKTLPISISKLMSGIIPEMIIPEEMKEGYGDGLVAASSSILPYADEHKNFHVNHASILCDKEVREYILKKISSI